MYYIAKIFQAAALTILAVAFFKSYPELMSYQSLGVAILFFACGWLIQAFMLK